MFCWEFEHLHPPITYSKFPDLNLLNRTYDMLSTGTPYI